MVPEGWQKLELCGVADFLDGKRKPLKSDDRAKIKGIYPYYGATGIIDWVNDFIFDDDIVLMGEDGENILSRSLPHVFKVCGKSWVNNHAHVLKPRSFMDIDYLVAYLESLNYEPFNTGSAQPKLNKAVCESIKVLVPPVLEQQKIGSILSTWDKSIEATERLLENSKKRKKALMQQLLTGKKRLPGFNGEWKRSELGMHGTILNGLTYSPDDVLDDGLLVLRSSNVKDQELVFTDNIYVREDVDYETRTRAGDILICVRNGSRDLIGKSAFISDKGVGHAHGAFMSVFRPHKNQGFFNQLLKSRDFFRNVHRDLGATINSINGSNLKKYKFLIPTDQEQNLISQILGHCDSEVRSLSVRLNLLNKEKSALMQQLLTGKKRVKVEEAA